jgi:CRP/FNR family transcriptional regulator, cyclic AMP receptor protein
MNASSDMIAERAHQLGMVDLFRGLGPAELGEIDRCVRVRQFRSQQIVVEYLDDSHDMFFVLAGALKVTFYSESGRQIDFRDLHAGESFGELSAIDGQRRSASVIAQTDATVAAMTAPDFLTLLRGHPELAMATLRKLTMLVRSLSERVQEQAERVEVRICHELLRMARGSMINPTVARLTPAPKHVAIANRVNTHREAVTRLFTKLKDQGIMQRGRGELLIKDVSALEAFAHRLHGS